MKTSKLQKIVRFGLDFVKVYKNIQNKGAYAVVRTPARALLQQLIYLCNQHEYKTVGGLDCTCYMTAEPVSFENRFSGLSFPIKVGNTWAKNTFDCAYFHVTGTLPAGYKAEDVVFVVDVSGEGLIYDKEGNPKQGITTHVSSFDYTLGFAGKTVVYSEGLVDENGKIEFFIDAGANDLFGRRQKAFTLDELSVAVINKNIRGLGFDLEALTGVWDINGKTEYTKELFKRLAAIKGIFPLTEEKAIRVRKLLKPFLVEKSESELTYTAIGHAHLDLAWLWPIRETKRKGARTFANQLVNLEKYPWYIFGASQAQLYVWMKDNYPTLFEKMKEYYAQGRWEIQGALWVEPDTNLISGESLVRQVYYGKKYFLDEFGEEMKILWLPDSFGYSACLPQVMKLADVPYFLTQKMSWNTVTKFPHTTFYWKGLDGSTVLAHMPPEDTYNSPVTAARMNRGEKNHKEINISKKALSLFGIGDGGGGPGIEHLERTRRFYDLKGAPKYRPGKAKDFFDSLTEETVYPEYRGELYLEKHQGTYTTHTQSKKYNRKIEFLLRNYEMLMVAALKKGLSLPISKNELETIWKEVLLYQFHDILPGSSIDRVYAESHLRYAKLFKTLSSGIEALASSLASGRYINFNSFAFCGAVKTPAGWKKLSVPALGTADPTEAEEYTDFQAKAQDAVIENDCVRVTFDKKTGTVIGLFDKSLSFEFAPEGKKLNRFYIRPDDGNGWDIVPAFSKTRQFARVLSFKTGTDGATAFAEVELSVMETRIKQKIFITDGSPLVTFKTTVKHKGTNRMLRVLFPQTVKSDKAKFNIQFGHLERSMKSDTDAEKAQYEVSAQKFVDISDGVRGLSLINDCKYGYKCKNGVFDMNILRSPNPKKGPSKSIDQGESSFVYALYPHEGNIGEDTYKQAYFLNNPILLAREGKDGGLEAPITIDNERLVVESVKYADDGSGFIARIYNCTEEPQSANISSAYGSSLSIVGIMENEIERCDDGKLTLNPFELANIKVSF